MAGDEIPIECRARLQWIVRKGKELAATFHNGNRMIMLEELEAMEPRAAFAVLVTIENDLRSCRHDADSLWRFLSEVA